ncbi:hypothetical protein G6F22_016393 [Rhizopus arrhizus]|nr:hypothetical protein G6F22_016393 [Rhizopus arrhizus]
MAAAAEHLVPVTLELGGKSPAIVCRDFPLDKAATRLATGKWFNAGQTCIAPDYVLIDTVRQREFVQALQQQVRERYGDFSDAEDYTRIINEGQYRRLQGYLAQARERGVPVIPLAQVDEARADPDARGDLRPDPAGTGLPGSGCRVDRRAVPRSAAGAVSLQP